eukprot:2690744-Rhodomonas_salina.2
MVAVSRAFHPETHTADTADDCSETAGAADTVDVRSSSMDDFLRDSLPIEKDVEGLCHTYRHLLYHNTRYVQVRYKSAI